MVSTCVNQQTLVETPVGFQEVDRIRSLLLDQAGWLETIMGFPLCFTIICYASNQF